MQYLIAILRNSKTKYLSLLLLVAIIVLSLVPLDIKLYEHWVLGIRLDYLAHFVAFFPLLFIAKIIFSRAKLLYSFIGLAVFIFGLELIQGLIPYRQFDIYDLIAGEVGLLASYITLLVNNKKYKMA